MQKEVKEFGYMLLWVIIVSCSLALISMVSYVAGE